MAKKKLMYDADARAALLRGVETLARAVTATLGPQGRHVALQRSFGSPIITKDGVTVAKDVELPGAEENLGAAMVREVAKKTSSVAGDGTTTATALAAAIVAWRILPHHRSGIALGGLWSIGGWLMYAVFSNNYGGMCCSIRWFLPKRPPRRVRRALRLRPDRTVSIGIRSNRSAVDAPIAGLHRPPAWRDRRSVS